MDLYSSNTSDQDDEYSEYNYEDLPSYSDEEVQCHMDRLEWEQAKLTGEVGRTCPPFWDREEDQQFIFSSPL